VGVGAAASTCTMSS